MQRNFAFGLVAASLGAASWIVVACGGGDDNGNPGDASADAADAGNDAPFVDDSPPPPPDDAAKVSCVLDDGTDPVFLCSQKLVLGRMHDAVWVPATGVFASWDSTSGVADTTHDLHDDAAWGAAINGFTLSASRYGDNTISPLLDRDLTRLPPILKAELATLPNEYGGELYQHLRDTAVGLRYLDQNMDADAIDALADAYGRAIYGHYLSLGTITLDGGAGDAGDGGSTQVEDGVLVGDMTNKDYAPADVATGAQALVDMAVRHATDDAANAAKWVTAAQASLNHIYLRGREPVTKMYYRLLTPSAAPDHDDVSPRATAPQDLLTTDAVATVALAVLRTQDYVAKLTPADGGLPPAPLAQIAGYPFLAQANDAIASANGKPSLYDADKGGYLEGYIPSTSTVLGNKPTRSNALMLAAIHRANYVGVSPYGTQSKSLRDVVGARTPQGIGLLSAVFDQNGYFQATAPDFSIPPSADAGVPIAHPNSYVSAATLIAVEAANEEWIGHP